MTFRRAVTLPENPSASLPWGLSAWLPEDCERLRGMEHLLRTLFKGAGAGEIATPAFEFASTIEAGFGNPDKLFRFFDRDGAILALRPELTTPAARLYAAALSHLPKPARIFYIGQVFRQAELHSGSYREFRQAGFECFGGADLDIDVELLRLASDALAALGCNDAVIEIGHAGIVKSLLDEHGIDGAVRHAALERMEKRSRFGVSELKLPPVFSTLLDRGNDVSVLAEARTLLKGSAASAHLEYLGKVISRVSSITHRIIIDLAAIRSIDYYTGIVFEGLMSGMPRPILSGGRYDALVGHFGDPTPATGFSIELEALLRSHRHIEND